MLRNKLSDLFIPLKRNLWVVFILLTLLVWYGTDCLLSFQKAKGITDNIMIKVWVLYGSVCTALAGWIFSAYISLHNSIKQHTFNILLQTRLNGTFQDHKDNIFRVFSENNKLTPILKRDIEEYNSDSIHFEHDKAKAFRGIDFLLNHYEFIAAGIHHGDLDEPLLKSCLRGVVCEIFLNTEHYRQYLRGEDRCNCKINKKLLEHLYRLYERWKDS